MQCDNMCHSSCKKNETFPCTNTCHFYKLIFAIFKDLEMNFRLGKPHTDVFATWVSSFLQPPLQYESSVVNILLYPWICGNVVEWFVYIDKGNCCTHQLVLTNVKYCYQIVNYISKACTISNTCSVLVIDHFNVDFSLIHYLIDYY